MTRNNHARRRDVRAYMAHHGVTYTQAMRALEAHRANARAATAQSSGSSFRVRPVDEGGPEMPAVVTRDHDVNPVCGHWLGNQCNGCGVCTTCDGCYCAELRHEAALDAYHERLELDHEKHQFRNQPDEDCPECEYDAQRTKGFTECPKCHHPLTGINHFLRHNPPYCHPNGSLSIARQDWSHLIGKHVTIDTRWRHQGIYAHYAKIYTGTVTSRFIQPRTGIETQNYELRLDPDSDASQPRHPSVILFNPRDYTITETQTAQ